MKNSTNSHLLGAQQHLLGDTKRMPKETNQFSIPRTVLAGPFVHAASDASILGNLDDATAYDPLADHIDLIIHGVSELDPLQVERMAYLLGVIAKAATNAVAAVDQFHASAADQQPATAGDQW